MNGNGEKGAGKGSGKARGKGEQEKGSGKPILVVCCMNGALKAHLISAVGGLIFVNIRYLQKENSYHPYPLEQVRHITYQLCHSGIHNYSLI